MKHRGGEGTHEAGTSARACARNADRRPGARAPTVIDGLSTVVAPAILLANAELAAHRDLVVHLHARGRRNDRLAGAILKR